jgi:hypothetical protein
LCSSFNISNKIGLSSLQHGHVGLPKKTILSLTSLKKDISVISCKLFSSKLLFDDLLKSNGLYKNKITTIKNKNGIIFF